jgi:midasin
VLERQLRDIQHVIQRGTSRFEWVDSVLVKAVCQGEWALFENANLCNPSILDRLNPLLEEGNQSLSINEQGLLEGDQIREIKAHEGFRAIFALSSSTLMDQGRDVSRALRNRCLQLNVHYNEDTDQPA